jgi:ElaB/YqjD/DUF883 family membrane-anchored ribosome-binding protein
MESFYDEGKSASSTRQTLSKSCEQTFDVVKRNVAGRLRQTAEKLNVRSSASSPRSEWVKVTSQTHDWINQAADKIEAMDAVRLKSDFENGVRRNPGRSLLIALTTGLVLGTVLRRR